MSHSANSISERLLSDSSMTHHQTFTDAYMSTLATSRGHGLLQAPRLELSGPGYDLLPFELETAQPSRIKVQSGEPNIHVTSCANFEPSAHDHILIMCILSCMVGSMCLTSYL